MQEPPLYLPSLTSQSTLRTSAGLQFCLLRAQQGPVWIPELTTGFVCLSVLVCFVCTELQSKGITLDHLVPSLHVQVTQNKARKEEWVAQAVAEGRPLAVQSGIRLSPVILFQNLESYEVKTKRDFKDFYSISGSQNFLSSGKKNVHVYMALKFFIQQ